MNIITDKALNCELTQKAIGILKNMKCNPDLYRFGCVCKYNHVFSNHQNLPCSIRLISTRQCFFCKQQHSQKRKELNSQIIKEKAKEYRIANRERFSAYGKQYRADNRSAILAYKKESYLKNPEKAQIYYQENREIIRSYKKKHAKDNPEYYSLQSQKRRAIKSDNCVKDITTTDLQDLLFKFQGKCTYCGVKFSKHSNVKKHLDHVIPLIKGGKHSIDNLVPACEYCNLSKHSKLLNDWYPKQPFYSATKHRKILVHIKDIKAYNSLLSTLTNQTD